MPDAGGASGAGATSDASDAGATARWDRVLTELEQRLERWQAALEGDGPYPGDMVWPRELGPCPDALAGRARRVEAAQQDLMARLSMRREALGALLRTGAAGPGGSARPGRAAPAPLFVDQHS